MADSPLSSPPKRAVIWPWTCLVIAMIWVAFVRVPLILNAETHLDSDLAVDGLTLLEATQGHLRWHFPGTPHLGIGPVLVALPVALVFGATPITLVVGGVIAYELVVLASFLLIWRVFGVRAAAWSLIPLAFSSVGTIWLSGRLTGGHLLTVSWYAGTLIWFHAFLSKGGVLRALHLGLWCGFGFYLDSMFLSAFPPMLLAVLLMLVRPGTSRGRALTSLAFLFGFALGDLPREVGYRHDPYDSYREQFDTILVRTGAGPGEGQIDLAKTTGLAKEHARVLVQECLPRLVTGHRLVGPNLPWEPTPEKFGVGVTRPETSPSLTSILTILITSALFVLSTLVLMGKTVGRHEPACRATSLVIVLTSAIVTAGFVINKNIFNSDNYRYLVFWLVAWAAGFGLLMDGLWQRGNGGRVLSAVLSLSLAATLTLDTLSWYRSLGWVDGLRPVIVQNRDPAYAWLAEHPEIRGIFGDYWDVYRLQFLLGSRVQGLPYPVYPDRYDTAQSLPARRPRHLVGRPGQFGPFYMDRARIEGGTVLYQNKDLTIIDWPTGP